MRPLFTVGDYVVAAVAGQNIRKGEVCVVDKRRGDRYLVAAANRSAYEWMDETVLDRYGDEEPEWEFNWRPANWIAASRFLEPRPPWLLQARKRDHVAALKDRVFGERVRRGGR